MGNQDLPPVTDCDAVDEDPCTEPAEIQVGEKLLVTDPTSKCNKTLENKDSAIPHTDGTSVQNRTGAEGDEIVLDKLWAISGTFPYIRAQNGAGAEQRLAATSSCKPHVLQAKDGSWEQVELEQNSCWETICECVPEMIAGFVEQVDCDGNKVQCLVMTDVQSIQTPASVIHFKSSTCLQLSGAGTAGNPYTFDVKISADEDNCIECRDDGLYVECGSVYGGDDPVDEL